MHTRTAAAQPPMIAPAPTPGRRRLDAPTVVVLGAAAAVPVALLLPGTLGPNVLGGLLVAGACALSLRATWRAGRQPAARRHPVIGWAARVLFVVLVLGLVGTLGFAGLVALLLSTGM